MLGPCKQAFQLAVVFASGWLLAANCASAAPAIEKLSLRGLRTGAETTLVIDGAGLSPDVRAVIETPQPGPDIIAEQSIAPGSTDRRVELKLKLASAEPGVYPLRLVSPSGISAPALIGVDALPQQAMVEPIAAMPIEKLPIALSGALNGATVVGATFQVKAGQRITADVEGRRLGSLLNPTLHLLDDRRVQIAWSQPTERLQGDACLEATAPRDGAYRVELHDRLFRGADPGYFRLKLGELATPEFAFPLAVTRDVATKLRFEGGALDAREVELLAPFAQIRSAPWPASIAAATGAAPLVFVADHATVVEALAAAGKERQKLPAMPVGISGRLNEPLEEDRFVLPVSAGEAIRLEVFASRLGTPVDASLAVVNEQGGLVATADDSPGSVDPVLEFNAPADAKNVIVAIRDLRGAGSAKHLYYLQATSAAQPGLTLTSTEDRLQVPSSGVALLRLKAARRGFEGAIKFAFEGLPPGVIVSGNELPAGCSEALFSVTAPGASPAFQRLQVIGEAVGVAPPLKRRLLLPAAVLQAGPLTVAWSNAESLSELTGGTSAPIDVAIQRGPNVAGAVRLSLITTQSTPKKTVKVNNQDQQVDDVEATLRLQTTPVIAADASSIQAMLIVPFDLPVREYDLAVQAELLAADNQTVIAATSSTVRRLVGKPGQKPVGADSLVIFEDEAGFAAMLNEGGGQASVINEDKYSGASSLKVTPDQKVAASLAKLGVKIRENPGPGEYRYLAFAWKKQGGQGLCLQLNHDGQWGPSGNAGAKFRYHAGPGPECFGASLVVDSNLPAGFVMVKRDLFADFGEFTLNGLAFSPVDGDFALFDHIVLGRKSDDAK